MNFITSNQYFLKLFSSLKNKFQILSALSYSFQENVTKTSKSTYMYWDNMARAM